MIRGFLEPKPQKVGRFLLLLSGGPCSLALAYMTSETVNSKTQSKRKMFIEGEMLHIDESVFYPWDRAHREDNLKKLEDFAALCGMPLTVVSLEEKYKISEADAESILQANSDRGSCREDTITFFRNSAIQDFALKHRHTHLLIGDSGLRVASSHRGREQQHHGDGQGQRRLVRVAR